eukprot:CAMPEP_0203856250 /NCGR_PEP_ID=MMETSP0359-20131031/10073_1 /ASSEMBLY_ACC=CAM_ASM_000338 /TAXON_ID=268821 /ORGANISM="Scrippsiella Hangoei, Strain SHTV-5" /LENGTH=382 /DNA_ID=CAMNT_0050772843 /DNA_START=73 /DNA_END=1221 /DNA_ORIENTATION=-
MLCQISKRNTAKQMTLRWRGTFIDVEDDGAEMPCRRPRSLSEPPVRVDSSEDWAGFGQEQAYVGSLSQKLACLNRDVRCVTLFFEGNCKVEPEVVCQCSGGADNLSVASTSTPTAGCSDMISASSSQEAVLLETVDTAMQLAQGMFQNVGQCLFVAACGAQQLPQGAGVPNAINHSVADMIMQVKAYAFKADAFGVDSARVGMIWADASADSPDALAAPMFESPICSQGSVGHPELCSRPCLYFAMGSCDKGESCEFCHMAHTKRPVHLDKRQRELLRSMSPWEWAALVLPILQKKIESLDDSLETKAMLIDIASSCGIALGSVTLAVPQRSQRMMILTMRSMSLRSLLTAVQRGLSERGHQVEEAVDALLRRVRRQAGAMP